MIKATQQHCLFMRYKAKKLILREAEGPHTLKLILLMALKFCYAYFLAYPIEG